MANSISFKTKYTNSNLIREYEFTGVDDEAIVIETVRTKVMNINASLAGGQASALANLFVSDDYDSQENIGTLENIYDVKIKVVTETFIPQTSSINRLIEMPEDLPDELKNDSLNNEEEQ